MMYQVDDASDDESDDGSDCGEEMEDVDYIGSVPTVQSVQQRINDRYDKLIRTFDDGRKAVHVCSICDEILMHEREFDWIAIEQLKKKRHCIQWSALLKEHERIPELEAQYTFNHDPENRIRDKSWLSEVALSPRGCIGRPGQHGNAKYSFSCCKTCKASINSNETPFYSIVNQNFVGCPPDCLKELNELELAFITPVECWGYAMTYIGGAHKNLKGTFSFMRVKERSVARAAMHMERMGLCQHIVVLIQGPMTEAQHRTARKKNTVRPAKIIAAVEWLKDNHVKWKGIDLDELREQLENVAPIVIDNSWSVESENTNIEKSELFTCYIPDSTVAESTGGFDTTDAFKDYVARMAREGFDVSLNCKLDKEYLNDQDGDHITSSCLLQFPYGLGGPFDRRVTTKGTFTTECDHQGFYSHLSKLSQPVMQQALFQLVMYHQISKLRLLRSSFLQVRGNKTAEQLASGLTYDDVRQTAKARGRRDYFTGTDASKKLLSCVDGMARSLPHTDEASKVARANSEAMYHEFGTGSIFLTATFDDNNSFILQVLCHEEIDDDTPLEDLSDDELAARVKKRVLLRQEYPGMTSVHFEMLLMILVEEVVGWDMSTDSATEKAGLFGECIAFAMAIEEQGRKTLHVHMTLWIKHYLWLQRRMFFAAREADRAHAASTLAFLHSRTATTNMFDDKGQGRNVWSQAFDHDCTVPHLRDRQAPVVTSNQQLRHLRHKLGWEYEKGKFASCPHCEKTWTYEELLNDYVRHTEDLTDKMPDSLSSEDRQKKNAELPIARMKARIIEFQKFVDAPIQETPVTCINASTNHHDSKHVNSCFRCGKPKKKGHVHNQECECRFRKPDLARPDTLISNTQLKGGVHKWFTFRGEEINQPLVEFLVKRKKYDLFQNVSCKAISESKFACNSNVQHITDGPLGQYQFKYNFKNCNGDETAAYEKVADAIKRMNGERRHQDDRKEGIRVLCRATFAHNKKNIIGAPFANYLTRNLTRVYFSHKSESVPLKDLIRVENKQAVSSIGRYNTDGKLYFENNALNYLCRHPELEDLSPLEFYTQYEPCNIKKTRKRKASSNSPVDDNGQYPFVNTDWFSHPSIGLTKRGQNKGADKPATRGVQERDHALLPKIAQWMFTDAKKFGESICMCADNKKNKWMEEYAQLVLTLLVPHRRVDDLKSDDDTTRFPYTTKLQEIFEDESPLCDAGRIVFTKKNSEFLQNIQDARHNSLRYKIKGDALQSCTEPFNPKGGFRKDEDCEDEEEEEAEEECEPTTYEDLLAQQFDGPVDLNDQDPEFLAHTIQNLSFGAIRDKGRDKCGYHDLDVASCTKPKDGSDFVQYAVNLETTSTPELPKPLKDRSTYTKKEVIEVLLTRTVPATRANVFKNKDVKVSEANGTVGSLREWAEAQELDDLQKRAFESITAAFLLTFFETEADDTDNGLTLNEKLRFRRTKMNLIKLKGTTRVDRNGEQLVCLMHGPGGSGKSTVIELVTAYCQEYCGLIGHTYTSRTIVIIAMSGVAATLIHGETAHQAFGINRSKVYEHEKEDWTDTRLVIIDEISFCSAKEFKIIHDHLKELGKSRWLAYGGLNVVFCGDFSQLEPVAKDCVYKDGNICPEFHGELNCYIELEGMHRFKDDPAWGERCLRFREGRPTLEDIKTINESCLVTPQNQPPPNVQVATKINANRDAINSQVFEEFCKKNKPADGSVLSGAIVILMDDLVMTNDQDDYVPMKSNETKKWFWENCGEDDCKTSNDHGKSPNRVDPMLKLYYRCPIMLVQNKNVPKGQANGSRVFLQTVNVKPNEEPILCTLKCGTTIRVFRAQQIKSLVVEQENDKINPRSFEITPTKEVQFLAKMKIQGEKLSTKMKGTQFPTVSNSATTGHKLQGYTAKQLLVNDWQWQQNWAYVVLSRVTEMKGLFLREPLTENLDKYRMNEHMLAMIRGFREDYYIDPLSMQDYESMMDEEANLDT